MQFAADVSSNRTGNAELIKFAALIALTEFVRGAYLNYLPLYSYNALILSEAIVGTVIFAYFFGETVSKIGIGWLLDRFNNRVILLSGLLLSLVSLYVFQFITSPVLLAVNGALIGLGFAPVWLVVLGYVSSMNEEKRASGVGMIYSAWLVGLGLGSVCVNFLISSLGYNFTLNILVGIWILCMILVLFIRKGMDSESEPKSETRLWYKEAFNDIRRTRYLSPGMFLQTLSITALAPVVPKFLTDTQYVGLEINQYGIVLGAIGMVTVILMLFFGKAAKVFKTENLFIFGLLSASVGVFGMGSLKNLMFILFFGLIIAVSYSVVLPAWYTILSGNVAKDNKGVMWGVFSTIEGIGRSVGPLLGGLLGSYISLHYAFYFSGIILLGLSLFYYFISKKGLLKSTTS